MAPLIRLCGMPQTQTTEPPTLNHAHPIRKRFHSHRHSRHCFSRAGSNHLIPRTDRVDAACGILDRRPHGRSLVLDLDDQEDEGEVIQFLRGTSK